MVCIVVKLISYYLNLKPAVSFKFNNIILDLKEKQSD